MKFFNLVKHDFINGIFRRKIYLLIPLLFIFMCFDCNWFITVINQRGFNSDPGTFMDYVIYIFRGMAPFAPESNPEGFRFPTTWLILFIFSSYTSLSYPFDDLNTWGQQIIIRVCNRTQWWLSKVLWNIASSISFFLLGIITVLVFCVIRGIPISFDNTEQITISTFVELFSLTASPVLSKSDALFICILSPFFVAMTLNLLQMVVALLTSPIVSFFASLSILILSAFWTNPFAIGNYAMIMRLSRFTSGGVSVLFGFALNLFICVVAVVAGLIYFRKYDILTEKYALGGAV